MLNSLWRRLRKRNPIPFRGKDLSKGQRPSLRPKLEALEDRTLPAPLVYGNFLSTPEVTSSATFSPPLPEPIAIPTSGDLGGLQPIDSQPSSPSLSEIAMMVMENSADTVIDLDPIFNEMSGLQPEDGLQLSLLGNTNPGLVQTDLSGGELTLTYTPSQSGTATITVSATDADGVCEQGNVLVTVLPAPPTTLGAALPTSVDQMMMSMPPSPASLA